MKFSLLCKPLLLRWYSNLRDRISSWNHFSIAVTVVFSVVGTALLAFEATKVLGQLLVATMAIFALIAFVAAIWSSFPSVFLSLHDKIGSEIDPDDLKNFLQKPLFVGVVGSENVGKTTFVDACFGRKYENKSTDRPYARILALPDTLPQKYVALIDTVGGSYYSQFRIQGMSDALLFFLDHSTSNVDPSPSKERLGQHQLLVQQLGKALYGQGNRRKVIIVCNKAELWGGQQEHGALMDAAIESARQAFDTSGRYAVADILHRHSNTETAKIACVVAKLAEL